MISISPSLSGIIFDQREKVPVSMVWIYDTTNTVPSSGIFVQYHSGIDPTLPGSMVRTQFEPMIFNDWNNGMPVEMSNYIGVQVTNSGLINSDPFSVVYSGYFYAETSGTYTFGTKSIGGTQIFIDNNPVLTGTAIITGTTIGYSSGMWNGKAKFWSDTVDISAGWHDFKLNYYWDRALAAPSSPTPMLGAFYTAPGSTSKVLSASVLSPYPAFIQPTIIADIMNSSCSSEEDLATVASFEVNLPISGATTWDNNTNEFGYIKLNRLVKLFMGYVTESGYYATSGYTTNLNTIPDGMIQKFTGLVDQVSLDQNKDSITAIVRCRDFFKKLDNALNENYPNRINYTQKVITNLDPGGYFNIDSIDPQCYDNWKIYDVVETLALNGKIDPSNINIGLWDTQNYFKLESNLNWPKNTVTEDTGQVVEDGDPYIFQYQYGEKLGDELRKIADLVGYKVYFNESGYLVFKEPRGTNRVEIYEESGYGSNRLSYPSGWDISLDKNALNRVVISPTGVIDGTTTVSFDFNGIGFGLYYVGMTSGSEYRVDIEDNTNSIVFSNTYTTSGYSRSYGNLNSVTRNLEFGSYTARVYPSGNNVNIERFEYYTENPFSPKIILRDDRDITSITDTYSDTSVRNEVICIGQQISDKGYLYSKAIDLDSISNPAAKNYVGDKRTVTIIEPTIQSQRRLDWLSKNVLLKYKRKSNSISLNTQGLPQIQVGDAIGIYSRNINKSSYTTGVYDENTYDTYYVTATSSVSARGKHTSVLSLTDLPTIEAWTVPLSITPEILDLIFAQNNNTIFDNYQQLTLNSTAGYGYDCISKQAAFMSLDLWVDVDRLWVLIGDLEDGGDVFKNINPRDEDLDASFYSNPDDPRAILTDSTGKKIKLPQDSVWLHNGGGERWGTVTIPTASNKFNDKQWIGQRSNGIGRKDGKYPLAVWAQYKTADNVNYFQGVWVPGSGHIDERQVTTGWNATSLLASGTGGYAENSYRAYVSTPENPTAPFNIWNLNPLLTRLPAFVVNNSPMNLDMWIGPVRSGLKIIENSRLVDMSSHFDNFGNVWNYRIPINPSGTNGSGYIKSRWSDISGLNQQIIYTSGSFPYNQPINKYYPLAEGQNFPWRDGDLAVIKGPVPTFSDIASFWTDWNAYHTLTGVLSSNIRTIPHSGPITYSWGGSPVQNIDMGNGSVPVPVTTGILGLRLDQSLYGTDGSGMRKYFGFSPMGFWSGNAGAPVAPYQPPSYIKRWQKSWLPYYAMYPGGVYSTKVMDGQTQIYGLTNGQISWSPFHDFNYYVLRLDRDVKLEFLSYYVKMDQDMTGAIRTQVKSCTNVYCTAVKTGYKDYSLGGGSLSRDTSHGQSPTTNQNIVNADFNGDVAMYFGDMINTPAISDDGTVSYDVYNATSAENFILSQTSGIAHYSWMMRDAWLSGVTPIGYLGTYRKIGASYIMGTTDLGSNSLTGGQYVAIQYTPDRTDTWWRPAPIQFKPSGPSLDTGSNSKTAVTDIASDGKTGYVAFFIKIIESVSGEEHYIPMTLSYDGGVLCANPHAFNRIVP